MNPIPSMLADGKARQILSPKDVILGIFFIKLIHVEVFIFLTSLI